MQVVTPPSAPEPSEPDEHEPTPREVVDVPTRVDKVFNRTTLASGLFVLLLLTLVGFFLLWQSRPAIEVSGLFSFLTREEWRTDVTPPRIGVAGLLLGTTLVALVAVFFAIPLGILSALFITEYAGGRSRKWLIALVDLLAAVPSLLFGLWGFLYLSEQVVPLSQWLTDHLGWIPIFATDEGANLTGSIFIAGIVVALMVLPIQASVVREVFAQTPPGEKEAALALGSTRWGMIKTVVLPFGRGGIVGGSMLGLGRALGETIAVALLLPGVPTVGEGPAERGRDHLRVHRQPGRRR